MSSFARRLLLRSRFATLAMGTVIPSGAQVRAEVPVDGELVPVDSTSEASAPSPGNGVPARDGGSEQDENEGQNENGKSEDAAETESRSGCKSSDGAEQTGVIVDGGFRGETTLHWGLPISPREGGSWTFDPSKPSPALGGLFRLGLRWDWFGVGGYVGLTSLRSSGSGLRAVNVIDGGVEGRAWIGSNDKDPRFWVALRLGQGAWNITAEGADAASMTASSFLTAIDAGVPSLRVHKNFRFTVVPTLGLRHVYARRGDPYSTVGASATFPFVGLGFELYGHSNPVVLE